MEPQESALPQFIKDNLLVIVLGVGGLLFILFGAFQLLAPREESIVIEQSEATDTLKTSPAKEIIVDVEGAVEKPGVYSLPENARVQDALIKAGGMSKEVDREAIVKSLNLAAHLTDGAKIYIPFTGETTASIQAQSSGFVMGTSTETGGLISINSASSSQLDTLPGVGEVTAEKIIQNRPYSSLEDLVSKKAVTKSTFEKIKDKISL